MIFSGSHNNIIGQLEAIGTPVSIWEQVGLGSYQFISGNSLYQEILDCGIQSQIGNDIQSVLPRYILSDIKRAILSCTNEQSAQEVEVAIERHGHTRWWRFIFSPLNSEHNRRILNTCIDITEKKQLERKLATSMRRFEAVINSAYDGIITIDDKQHIKMFNKAAGEMFAIEPSDAIGMSLSKFIPARFRHDHGAHVSSFRESPTLSRPMHTRASVTGLRLDGSEFPLEVTISKIQVGPNSELTAVLRDISERAILIEELRQAASNDPLTGIYNRRYFEQQLNAERQRCQRFTHDMAIVMIDIDHFKAINDEHGHSYGDSVLKSLTKKILENIREVDIFARWGGDEFVLLLPETSLAGARIQAEKIRAAVEFDLAPVTLSMGITLSDGRTENLELLSLADRLLYSAKSQGRNLVIDNLPE